MSRRLVLALDGSTSVCSVALLEIAAGPDVKPDVPRTISRRTAQDERAHARLLLQMADEVLGDGEAAPGDLDAVVVGIGPGTFTGVRVTVATARGMALALDIPVLGVSTLSALASGVFAGLCSEDSRVDVPGRLCTVLVPLVDARRGQVFHVVYAHTAGSSPPSWVRVGDIGVCRPDLLVDRLRESHGLVSSCFDRICVVGEKSVLIGVSTSAPEVELIEVDASAEWLVQGQGRLEEPRGSTEGGNLSVWLREAIGGSHLWSAAGVAPGAPGTPESVVPIYVRAPDADLHITKMRDPWVENGSRGDGSKERRRA